MTVKTRIAIFVACAGFIASILFSIVVFYELIEQPFDLLDMELEEKARHAVKVIALKKTTVESTMFDSFIQELFSSWIEIYEQDSQDMLFQSDLAKHVKLPAVKPGSGSIVEVMISPEEINLGQGKNKDVPFRVRAFKLTRDGKKLMVQIGLPMVKLKEEIQELVLGLIAGLIFSSLALIIISYFVAGRILKPIGAMKDLAYNISEKNLDQRIPVGTEHDEFNELSRTINRMLDRLQFSFLRQRDFLFDTSHELKTPLTTMRLAIGEIMTSGIMDNLQPSLKENIIRIDEQVLRMEKLVKDLLNLSSLEILNSIDPKPVSLMDLLSSLIADYQFIADGRKIHLDIHLQNQLVVQGDEEKLKRAFSNLMDNSIKYNIDGGRIEVTGKQSNNDITIAFSNTGPGLTEAEVARAFEQFYRSEKSRSTQHGGSGLGLAIVKRIIELHGGDVKLESKQGTWTRVTVLLPRQYI